MTVRLGIPVAMAAMLAVGYGFRWVVLAPPPPVGPAAKGVALTMEAVAPQGAGHGPGGAVGRNRRATPTAASDPLAVDQGVAEWADPIGAEGDLGEEVPMDIGEPLEAESAEVVALVVAEAEIIHVGGMLDADDGPASDGQVPSVPDSAAGDFLDADDPPSLQPAGAAEPPVEIGAPLDFDPSAGY